MTVGENIKRLRKERGLTQKQLGEMCGIAESNIRKYESDKQNAKIETIEKIAQALGVPIVQIKENLTFAEHQQTEEFRQLERSSLPFEGMEVSLEKVFGGIEGKWVMGETGWQCPYWVVGKAPNTFVLYEPDIEALIKANQLVIDPPLCSERDIHLVQPHQVIHNGVRAKTIAAACFRSSPKARLKNSRPRSIWGRIPPAWRTSSTLRKIWTALNFTRRLKARRIFIAWIMASTIFSSFSSRALRMASIRFLHSLPLFLDG